MAPAKSGETGTAFDDLGLNLSVLSEVLICEQGAQTQIQLLFDPHPIYFAVARLAHFPGPRNGSL